MKRILFATLLVAGCAQLPPSPRDTQAKRFEAVPGMAVIYVVRTPMDSGEMGSLALNYTQQISTFGGTYYRWEVAPGTYRIAGLGNSNEAVTLNAAAGSMYFLEHTVFGMPFFGPSTTSLRQIPEQQGQTLVRRSQLLGG